MPASFDPETGKALTIDVGSPAAVLPALVTHELNHGLKRSNPKEWARLRDYLLENRGGKLEIAKQSYLDDVVNAGLDPLAEKLRADGDLLTEEGISRTLEEAILDTAQGQSFWRNMARDDRGPLRQGLGLLQDHPFEDQPRPTPRTQTSIRVSLMVRSGPSARRPTNWKPKSPSVTPGSANTAARRSISPRKRPRPCFKRDGRSLRPISPARAWRISPTRR